MRKVEEIESDIRELSPTDLDEFRRWFEEYDAELWDQQIEEDARTGKLDALAEQARAAFYSGKATEL